MLPLQIGQWPSLSSNYVDDSFLQCSDSWFTGLSVFIDSSYATVSLIPSM